MARSTFGRWFFGDDRVAGPNDRPVQTGSIAESSPYAGERDLAAGDPRAHAEPIKIPAGWYETEGTLRYFDGESWTSHLAVPHPPILSTSGIAGAAFLGVLAAFFILWLGAQIAPDHVYLPMKFVVKELPRFR